MVQKGFLSVELIDAQSKEAFKEHECNKGAAEKHYVDAFVEVEPGSEYFIRIANDSSDTIICNICVDGTDLGYEFCLGPNEYDDKGLWKLENGSSQHTALKVHKVLASPRDPTGGEINEIGVITVDFFEFVEGNGTEVARDFKSGWSGDKVPPSAEALTANDDSKKQVKSQKGSHSETLSNDDGKRKVYTYGDGIETVRLKYCTAVGLIVEGVLDKPPFWDWARMTQAAQSSDNENKEVNISPKILRRNTCDDSGKVIEIKEIEMFDLTALAD
mmetsp:Transcript_1715/g.2454  ORF Transcript_1715/g.2454 Transcript_1715/m.2454 type:complete len:273 (-) Transcript_1715:245-1063(-)